MAMMQETEGGVATLQAIEDAFKEEETPEDPAEVPEGAEEVADDPLAGLPGLSLKPLGVISYTKEPGGDS